MRRVLLVAAAAAFVARNTYVWRGRTMGWIRVFGWGVHWKNVRKTPFMFSERNGYTFPWLVVGSWWLTTLRPHRLRGGNRMGR